MRAMTWLYRIRSTVILIRENYSVGDAWKRAGEIWRVP